MGLSIGVSLGAGPIILNFRQMISENEDAKEEIPSKPRQYVLYFKSNF
jgi:hypothetical protein